MRIPDSLVHLLDEGIIDEVVRPLLAGKEAQIYWVICNGESRVAKVYKMATERSFHQRADYTEGRAVRNSRDQRAMRRGSRYGRAQSEKSWQTTEVDTIYRLKQAGVRVPEPHHFIDGVLIMELVSDANGMPAPRLSEAKFSVQEATAVYRQLLAEVVRMLCAGVIHGDLSDFNVLMDANGPVIIDFPQAIDAARNANAKKILLRDVENLHRFMARFIDRFVPLPYGQEIWQRYEQGTLSPTTQLEGRFSQKSAATDTVAMMDLIREAQVENAKLPGAAPRRRRGASQGPQAPRQPPQATAPRAQAHPPAPAWRHSNPAHTGGGPNRPSVGPRGGRQAPGPHARPQQASRQDRNRGPHQGGTSQSRPPHGDGPRPAQEERPRRGQDPAGRAQKRRQDPTPPLSRPQGPAGPPPSPPARLPDRPSDGLVEVSPGIRRRVPPRR